MARTNVQFLSLAVCGFTPCESLRRVLEAAHLNGLLLAPPHNGSSIVLAPRLLAAFLACMASELGNFRLWALEARQALELGERPERVA